MAVFGGLILTNNGRNLLAKAQTGKTLKFTKIVLGDGKLGSTESIVNITQLKNQVLVCNIIKKQVLQNVNATLTFHLNNQNLETGFYWREIGVIAEDLDTNKEILYCYGNAGENGEYISANGGSDILEKNVNVELIIDNVENVTAIIDDSIVYVTERQLEETITQLKSETNQSQEKLINDMSKTYTKTNIIADTVEGTGRINKIYGKCEQETSTESSNVLDISVIEDATVNGITLTKKDDGTILLNGMATSEASFISILKRNMNHMMESVYYSFFVLNVSDDLGDSITSGEVCLYLSDDSNTKDIFVNSNGDLGGTETLDDNIEYNELGIRIDSGTVLNNLKLYIAVAPTGTDIHEPIKFVPNMPSPEYPSQIKCVGDDVNLFDANKNTTYSVRSSKESYKINSSNSISISGVNCSWTRTNATISGLQANTQYTINADVLNTSKHNAGLLIEDDNNIVRSTSANEEFNSKISFITNNEGKITISLFSNWSAGELTETVVFKNIKLQKESISTTYSPYGYGTVETISKKGTNTSSNIAYVNKPLCYIKDSENNIIAQDYIDYNNKKVHRECGYDVFDGSDDENWTLTENANGISRFNLIYNVLKNGSDFICNKFKTIKQSSSLVVESIIQRDLSNDKSINIRISNTRLSAISVQGFKAWLQSNPIVIVYELEIPIIENIECSNKITQYDEQTTVYNRDNAEIEVSLTNNKAISEVNENLDRIEENQNFSVTTGRQQETKQIIDGKRVWVKRIDFGALPNATSKAVTHNLENVTFIDIRGIASNANGTTLPIPHFVHTSNQGIEISVNKTHVTINTSTDRSGYTAYVTLYFTKD